MDLSYIKKLIKLLSESDVDEIEIEEEGKKIRLLKHVQNSAASHPMGSVLPAPLHPSMHVVIPPAPAPAVLEAPVPKAAEPEKKLHEIKSPIVGTFYRAPAPDAAPFVEVGSLIRPGTVLCIVEAMKLMNEIESDVSGKIVKVMVENGQAVEYGQMLFLVEPM